MATDDFVLQYWQEHRWLPPEKQVDPDLYHEIYDALRGRSDVPIELLRTLRGSCE